ncbi:MAG: hypothetical protein MUF12_01895, partial [Sediminibacterium sp.]|nr:hypothetical protein [Sediminibacterium sp.]
MPKTDIEKTHSNHKLRVVIIVLMILASTGTFAQSTYNFLPIGTSQPVPGMPGVTYTYTLTHSASPTAPPTAGTLPSRTSNDGQVTFSGPTYEPL